MKLELKHLSAYLPYGLIVDFNRDNGMYVAKNVNLLKTSIRLNTTIGGAYIMYDNVSYGMHDTKPHLRPLSDLTKEIEHNGERLILGEQLSGKIDGYWLIDYTKWLKKGITEWKDMQLLFKYHFDVFGLLESELAIKKQNQ